MKYRKRPVVIDAVQWRGSKQSWDEIMDMGDVPWKPGPMGSKSFIITTLEGDHTVSDGDFVIKGVAGKFYPCNPDIFEKTYEPAEANAPDQERLQPSPGSGCSPSFRAEVARIANDYIPDNNGQAPQALAEMREALQSLLANAQAETSERSGDSSPAPCSPVWHERPDCPRCGKPLVSIRSRHGEWKCNDHENDGKCLWFSWELTMILRARLREANAR